MEHNKKIRLRKLIKNIADSAIFEPLLLSTRGRNKGTPGERILRLSQEDRDLLKTAKPEDFCDVRVEFIEKVVFGERSWIPIYKRELESKFNMRKLKREKS